MIKGELLLELGEIDAALKIFLDTKLEHKNIYSEKSLFIATLYEYIGDIYMIQSLEEKALKEYEKAQKIKEKIFNESKHASCASLYYKRALLKFSGRHLNYCMSEALVADELFRNLDIDSSSQTAGGLTRGHLFDLLAQIHLEMD